MTAKEYYLEHTSEIVKQLYDIGYMPHTIVEDAKHDNMDVYDYIILLLDIKLPN